MATKQRNLNQRRRERQSVLLEIELPALSDEAAAAMAAVLVQLYHRFEATYYSQILNHHASCGLGYPRIGDARHDPDRNDELF